MKGLILILLIFTSTTFLFSQSSQNKSKTVKKVKAKQNAKECKEVITMEFPQNYIVEIPQPKYPKTAQALGLHDDVYVQVKINTKGKVVDAKVLKGHPLLHEVSLESARKGKFKVFKLSSGPVCYVAQLNFKFSK